MLIHSNAFKLMPKEGGFMEYLVRVIVKNKPYINDPKGETILKDLITKKGYASVKSVRTAEILDIMIEAKARQEAKNTVQEICDELRIYNPVVSACNVEVIDRDQVK